jgi:hypothetical protein
MTRRLLLLGILFATASMTSARASSERAASQSPDDCFTQYWICSVTTDWSGTRPDCYETYVACTLASADD